MRTGSLLALLSCACGRIGYGEQPRVDAAEVDATTLDAPIDSPSAPVCPKGTTVIAPGADICIEQGQRGSKTWTNAKADCETLGRRLCNDVEWLAGCQMGLGMLNTVDDWEWVAENDGGIALKRGGNGACTDTSSHETEVDPFGYRCCTVKD